MFLRPIQTIFLLTFKLIFKIITRLGISKNIPNIIIFNSFYSTFRVLFSTSNLLINTIGFLPTYQILRTINQLIRRVAYHGISPSSINTNILSLQTLYPNLNNYPVEIITEAIRIYWKDCLKYPKLFSRLYTIFLIFNSFTGIRLFVKPIYFIFRLSIGSIISTLGILWSESLQSISFLKNFAYFIRDNLEYYFDINIPTLNTSINNPQNDRNEIIFYFGVFILGVLGIISIGCFTEVFIPNSISKIPYFGDLINTINSTIINWIDLFKGNKPSNPDINIDNSIINNREFNPNWNSPKPISSTSSGSSTVSDISLTTIRQSPIITPPNSRPMTPFENPNINTFDPGWEYYLKLIKINIKVENETNKKI